ncbi:hypothetical protein GQ457_12G012060 [Hibiscus cannabinus]
MAPNKKMYNEQARDEGKEENIHFKAFKDEGIEPELEYKMEQLFGVSVAQGVLKFTPVMDCSQHASVGYNQYECVDEMTSENITFTCGETNEKWQEIWNDSSPRSSPIHSPQSNEHETFERRGSKRTNEKEVLGSHKSAKVDSTRKIGGAALLTEKLDIMVEAITQRNKRDMELMKLEVNDMDLLAKCNGSRAMLHFTPNWRKWMHEVLCGHEKRCFNMFRMTQNTFRQLCMDLENVAPMQEEAQQLGTNEMKKSS